MVLLAFWMIATKKCGDKEFRCSPWRLDDQGLVWDVSFLHPIKIYLGGSETSCVQKQASCDSDIDAPYWDHLTVEGIWDVEQDGLDGNSCYLRVYINVAFSKKTIFRGKIDQSTKDECREVFGLWIKLGHDLLKRESSSRSKGASSSTNADDQSGDTVPDVTSAPDEPGVRSPVPPIQGHQQSIGRDSIASTSQELWSSLTSYMRSSQFGPVLAVTLVAIIILLQVTIIVLLTRSPKVYMVSHEASASSLGSYSKESIEWAQKRLSSLGEEMRMAEAHMERMRNEFAWLKSHLERLERLRRTTVHRLRPR